MANLNQWQKELLKLENQSSKALQRDLMKVYEDVLKDVRKQIRAYGEDFEDVPYYKQIQYGNLQQLQKEIVELLNSAEPEVRKNIVGFKEKELVEGYFQSMYQVEMESMQPIDFIGLNKDFIRKAVEKPVAGKDLSKRLYQYRDRLAKKAQSTLNSGIVSGWSYQRIADQIRNQTEANYKQALRIARTEGGRLRSEAKEIAYQEAIEKGVEFKKMWVSALDSRTRSSHRGLDGQIVDVDEDFTSPSGAKAQGPRLFGVASEDINCRCTIIATFEEQEALERRDRESNVIEYKSYNEWAKSKGLDINDINNHVYKYIDPTKINYFITEYGKISDSNYEKITDPENGYIRTINSFRINALLRDEDTFKKSTTASLNETIEILSKVVENNQLKESLLVDRWVDNGWLNQLYNDNVKIIGEKTVKNLMTFLNSGKATFESSSFVSTSMIPDDNVFKNRPVKLQIQLPKDSNVFVTRNVLESELILNKKTKYDIISAEIVDKKLNIVMRLIR